MFGVLSECPPRLEILSPSAVSAAELALGTTMRPAVPRSVRARACSAGSLALFRSRSRAGASLLAALLALLCQVPTAQALRRFLLLLAPAVGEAAPSSAGRRALLQELVEAGSGGGVAAQEWAQAHGTPPLREAVSALACLLLQRPPV
ncbi:MAG: hypothetical protein ACK40L_19360, partial [Hydrogenophaga sp.]